MTNIKPNIPNGGFFVAKFSPMNPFDLEQQLKSSGARTKAFPDNGLVLAAWDEFQGQGIWWSDKAGVAYDLDLTNQVELLKLVDPANDDPSDQGFMLWALYKKFGIDFLDKLRGAFGFALWDNESEILFVATDAYGIRPVVFSAKSGNFLAASRIRHIMLSNQVSNEIDPEAIYHYLFFQAVCSPVSIYKEIRKLEPGKGLKFTTKGLGVFTHYDIKYRPDRTKPERYWIEAIPGEIEKAVQKFVPLSSYEETGCFLSGGTDSSSIVGYYTKLAGRPAKTFSIGFDEPKYNELEYARIATNHFGTDQQEYSVTPRDVLTLVDELPVIYDEPFGNASVVPAYFCALAAKKSKVNVLLGGDGGDEIFGGNERYVVNLLFEKYFILPRIIRNSFLEPILAMLPPGGLIHRAQRYVRRANIPNPERFYSYNLLAETPAKDIFEPDFISTINQNCFLEIAKEHFNQADPASETNRLLYIDMKFTITDNDLRKVTQMVEAAGLRVRYPFLDRDLVDFCAIIPSGLKVKAGQNRYIFKRAMEGFLPNAIIKKTKHGMGLPIAVWFKSNPVLSELLYDTLFSGTPRILQFIRPEFLNQLKLNFESENTPYFGDNLWVFLMLELWLNNRKL